MSRHVLLTGTSSGFGAALVEAYAREGWHVTATLRDPDRAPESFASLDNVQVLRLDVTDSDTVGEAITAAQTRHGAIDVLVNVAGLVVQGALEEVSVDDWRRQFETNVFGLVSVTQAVLPMMRERGTGHIINFSSGAGLIGLPRIAAYSASKFAVEGLSESLYRELKPLGIQTTMVEPGVFQTELGNSAARPQHPVADYDAITDQLPGLYDWTPGDLAGAVRSIVGITAEDGAPLRLYLGHGLDEVRGHQKTRLEEWDRQQNLTESALQI